MERVLFTLCGRGGSRGVPGKNIRPFLGVPLIALTLYDALRAFEGRRDIEKIIAVDSDSEEILSVARKLLPQAIFHRRESSLAQDSTPKLAAIGGLLDFAENKTGRKFDVVVDMDITSPLRTVENVEAVCRVLKDSPDRGVVFSVVPARRNPYFNMVEKDSEGRVALCKEGNFSARQQAPLVYEMNASIYAYRRRVFEGNPLSPLALSCGIFEMRDFGVLDIDSEEDWELMELVYEHHCRKDPRGYLKAKLDHFRRHFPEFRKGQEVPM